MIKRVKNESSLMALAAMGAMLLPVTSSAASTKDSELPNVVWFLTEDLSPDYLAMFNDGKGCTMPNVEKLAKEGITYTNAYSAAAVSSAARTSLITGCYAPRFLGSFHRNLEHMQRPEGHHMFPTYLRRKGYHTSNAKKCDYNVVLDEESWDIIEGVLGDWRKREDKSQPFFHMRSMMETHESRLQFTKEQMESRKTITDPSSVYLNAFHPDTPLMRYTYATYYDKIHETDKEIGQMIEMLKEDGVLDNTFIFFFGDNGGVLPGTKGYTDNIGLHVPLVIYVPEKWRDKIDQPIGSVQEGLVSFIDFGPTLLNLAGIKTPKQMDGKPFLGKGSEPCDEKVVCYGDRYDEMYSFNRILRKGDFRYARNYQPFHPQSLFAFYRYQQLAFAQWAEMFKAGKLTDIQSTFFKPSGAEELFDIKNDPQELHNLANDPKYRDVLLSMRDELSEYVVDKADLGFFPENVIFEEGMANPATYGEKNRKRIARFQQVANLQMEKFADAREELTSALASSDDVEVWWALTTCAAFADEASEFKDVAKHLLLTHPRSFVRSKAMVFLSRIGERYNQKDVMPLFLNCVQGVESLVMMNDLTYLMEANLMKPFPLQLNQVNRLCKGVDWRVEYFNTLAAASKKR